MDWEVIISVVMATTILVVLLFVFVFIFRGSRTTRTKDISEQAGKYGEDVTKRHLDNLLRDNEYYLDNLLIPIKNELSTQIDGLLITHKGLFCIEVKNWAGKVIGDIDDNKWYQVYDDPRKGDREQSNPFKQNYNHIRALRRKLHNNYDIENVVIILSADSRPEDTYSLHEFKQYYKSLDDNYLTDIQIKAIYQMLYKYKATPEQIEKHNKRIKEKYGEEDFYYF